MTDEIMELPVGDLAFRVRVAGPADGPLVVLLHGYPQSSNMWHHQVPALTAAGYRTVAPDQRGYSPKARPESPTDYDMAWLVGDVIALADHFDAERFHLVGHDWGAIVAWYVAAWHPERLRSLTAVSVPHPAALARALNDPATDQAERSSYIEIFRSHAEDDLLGSPEKLRVAFEATGLAGHDVDEHVRVLSDPGALHAATNWYRAFDFHDGGLAPIEVPTLFVWSTDDPALGREGAEWTADHVRGPYQFEIIEGAPHWIPEAAPERLNDLLLNHLRARDEGSSDHTNQPG